VGFGTAAKATSGVAITANPNNDVRVAFAWFGNQTVGINMIGTFRCTVTAGQLQSLGNMCKLRHELWALPNIR
jgi:hypothetical protein